MPERIDREMDLEAFEPDRLLPLAAEMKLPCRAWPDFVVTGNDHSSTIHQTASFDPVGLSGLVYWYVLYPLHRFVFAGMFRVIVGETMRARRIDGILMTPRICAALAQRNPKLDVSMDERLVGNSSFDVNRE